ncbi:hypothetical protein C5L39_07175 [Corynebacterium alimapuense]|uniref:Serine hydrolase n=2 Tax=Corynebacterium alimapuense TaxID=1576874 RepID=A0A3M8K6V4_9CORY|nr:hypothetical protein C5L39_07175 [Corynebacterium alimapuense]
MALAGSLNLLAGCAEASLDAELPPVQTFTEQAQQTAVLPVEENLTRLINDIEAVHGGTVGIAVAGADGVVQVGDLGDSDAWSTIKVPVAITADAAGLADPELIEAAITVSDNDAAYLLRLQVDQTELPYVPELEELMGETHWLLADQAQFATNLSCLDTVGTTYDAMGRIVEWQDIGLGLIPEAHFKSGWGQETDDIYTYRQFGSVQTLDGALGLAVIAHPGDNTPETAEAMIQELGQGLSVLLESGLLGSGINCVE